MVVMGWNVSPLQNSQVDILAPSIPQKVFGAIIFKEVVKLKWDHLSGLNLIWLASL